MKIPGDNKARKKSFSCYLVAAHVGKTDVSYKAEGEMEPRERAKSTQPKQDERTPFPLPSFKKELSFDSGIFLGTSNLTINFYTYSA